MRGIAKVLGVLAVVGFGSASTARAQVDLGLTATDAPDPVAAGAQLTYTFHVWNLGPNAAGGCGWSAAIPTGSTFVSLSNFGGSAWICNTPVVGGTGGVNCDVQTQPPTDAHITFILVVAVNGNLADGAMLNLNANIFNEGGGQDTNLANNNVSIVTTVSGSSGSSSGPAVSSSQGVASSTGASSTAGTSAAGTSAAGTSAAGTSAAGTSTAGTSTAGTSTAGTSAAGTSAAGTSAAGTSAASSGVATSRPASSGGGSSVMASSRASSGATSAGGGSSTGGSSSTPASSTSQDGGGDDGGGFNLFDILFGCNDNNASASRPGLLSAALLLLMGWRWRRRGARQ